MGALLVIAIILAFYAVAGSFFSNWRHMALFTIFMGVLGGGWRYSNALEMADVLQIPDPSLPMIMGSSLAVACIYGVADWFLGGRITGRSKVPRADD